ncbi:MAG: FAD-dependent thymidylate synthase [Candidatus Hodarchaeales archaeon]|jgi:thymidylate synthase ThyX
MSNIISITPSIDFRPEPRSTLSEAAAAARTCYSPDIIKSLDITEGQKNRIGRQTFDSGHHTVFLHKMVSLDIVASRNVFHLLHYHPFYNSSQSSQRYVVFKNPEVIIPPDITGKARNLFDSILKEIWDVYHEITDHLIPIIKNNYPGKRKIDEKAAEKLAIETARYVLPIGAKSTAIHSIQLMTLLRLYRLAGAGAWGWELKVLLEDAIEKLKKTEPDLDGYISEPLGHKDTPESQYISKQGVELLLNNEKNRKKLKRNIGYYSSKLVDWNANLTNSLNQTTELISGNTDNQFQSSLDPIENPHLIDTLHTDWLAPKSRILTQGWVSFLKRTSHTANAQDQRHRTISSVTSSPELSETLNPDFITPELIKFDAHVNTLYEKIMKKIYDVKLELVKDYEIPVSSALYLTPNAHTLYIQQSGSLLGFRHKWILRSCWRSQREIWGVSMQEIEQVTHKWPELKPYLGPPCYVRYLPDIQQDVEREKRIWVKPKCTEGKMFCDVPVWLQFNTNMTRLI